MAGADIAGLWIAVARARAAKGDRDGTVRASNAANIARYTEHLRDLGWHTPGVFPERQGRGRRDADMPCKLPD